MNVRRIAKIAHEMNHAYCQAIGDPSATWDKAPQWQKNSAIDGVEFHLQNPDAGPAASHINWLALKEKEGWVYGPLKNEDLKEHPCMVPFEELPVSQQAKDSIFHNIVHALQDV